MKRIWWPTCLETLSRRIIAAWRKKRAGGLLFHAAPHWKPRRSAGSAALPAPCQAGMTANTGRDSREEISRANHTALSGGARRRHQRRGPASAQWKPARFPELAGLGRFRKLSRRPHHDGRRPAGDARADAVMETGDGTAMVGVERR